MMDIISSWGVHYLIKTDGSLDIHGRVACALAMLVYSISLYNSDDGHTFQAFFSRTDPVHLFGKDDFLLHLSREPCFAGRYFSSRGVNCDCISKRFCDHGFPNQAKGDVVYAFSEAFIRSLSTEMQMVRKTLEPYQVVLNITERLIQEDLAYWWESEETETNFLPVRCAMTRSRIIAFLVSFGVDCVAKQYIPHAIVIAMYIKSLEHPTLQMLVGVCGLTRAAGMRDGSASHMRLVSEKDFIKIRSDLCGDPVRQCTKFFLSRTSCDCLKEKYEVLRSGPMMGRCRNCLQSKERKQLMTCSNCRSVDYCSTACQVSCRRVLLFLPVDSTNVLNFLLFQRADWPKHKPWCQKRNGWA